MEMPKWLENHPHKDKILKLQEERLQVVKSAVEDHSISKAEGLTRIWRINSEIAMLYESGQANG